MLSSTTVSGLRVVHREPGLHGRYSETPGCVGAVFQYFPRSPSSARTRPLLIGQDYVKASLIEHLMARRGWAFGDVCLWTRAKNIAECERRRTCARYSGRRERWRRPPRRRPKSARTPAAAGSSREVAPMTSVGLSLSHACSRMGPRKLVTPPPPPRRGAPSWRPQFTSAGAQVPGPRARKRACVVPQDGGHPPTPAGADRDEQRAATSNRERCCVLRDGVEPARL